MNVLDCPKRVWIIFAKGDGIAVPLTTMLAAPMRQTVARYGPDARVVEYLRVDDVEMED